MWHYIIPYDFLELDDQKKSWDSFFFHFLLVEK